MTETERERVRREMDRMISKSRNSFEKPQYIRLVLRSMADGRRYTNLHEALRENGPAYEALHVSSSNWKMILGEIENTYFQGTLENALINGLDSSDVQSLLSNLMDKIG